MTTSNDDIILKSDLRTLEKASSYLYEEIETDGLDDEGNLVTRVTTQ